MPTSAPGFHVAAFAIDGTMEGFDFWPSNKLSEKWLKICRQYLTQHGNVFEASWAGNLSHIQTKVTKASGAALVTFSVRGKLAASLAMASGRSSAADDEVLRMFVDSLRRVELVRAVSRSARPFESIISIAKRPLLVVVPWPESTISDDDHACVQELAIHLTAALIYA